MDIVWVAAIATLWVAAVGWVLGLARLGRAREERS